MSLTKTNTAKIYSLLKRRGSLTRREIAERLNLECGEVAELIHAGKVTVQGSKLSPITKRPVECVRVRA
jgi:hypothetical protein